MAAVVSSGPRVLPSPVHSHRSPSPLATLAQLTPRSAPPSPLRRSRSIPSPSIRPSPGNAFAFQEASKKSQPIATGSPVQTASSSTDHAKENSRSAASSNTVSTQGPVPMTICAAEPVMKEPSSPSGGKRKASPACKCDRALGEHCTCTDKRRSKLPSRDSLRSPLSDVSSPRGSCSPCLHASVSPCKRLHSPSPVPNPIALRGFSFPTLAAVATDEESPPKKMKLDVSSPKTSPLLMPVGISQSSSISSLSPYEQLTDCANPSQHVAVQTDAKRRRCVLHRGTCSSRCRGRRASIRSSHTSLRLSIPEEEETLDGGAFAITPVGLLQKPSEMVDGVRGATNSPQTPISLHNESANIDKVVCGPGYAVSLKKGARRHQEDMFLIEPRFSTSLRSGKADKSSALTGLFGVFDGHGILGKTVADHAAATLPTLLADELSDNHQSDPEPLRIPHALQQAFKRLDDSCIDRILQPSTNSSPMTSPIVSESANVPRPHSLSEGMGRPMTRGAVGQGGGGGSTAVVVYIARCAAQADHDVTTAQVSASAGPSNEDVNTSRRLWVANLGDSRCVLSRSGSAVALSRDHTPERDDEKARIEGSGGHVVWVGTWRVEGVLAVTRSLGDWRLKLREQGQGRGGLVSDPEIECVNLSGADEFAILASDGLWRVLDNQKAVDIARSCISPLHACEALSDAAFAKGAEDNVTVLVLDLSGYFTNKRRASVSTTSATMKTRA